MRDGHNDEFLPPYDSGCSHPNHFGSVQKGYKQQIIAARVLEIIAPAGPEQYFAELGELVAEGVMPNDPRRLGLAEKYHIDYDRSRIGELLNTYHLKFGVSIEIGDVTYQIDDSRG